MSFLLAALLAGIFGLFFYRWVEPHHKRTVGKVAIGTVAVLAVAIAGIAAYMNMDNGRHERFRNNVVVRHLPSPLTPSEKADNIWAEFRVDGPRSEVTFEICNRNPEPLASITFYPKAFNRGRSTAHGLRQPQSGEGYVTNAFESDRIVAPSQCDTVTWPGKFLVRDSIEAQVTTAALLR